MLFAVLHLRKLPENGHYDVDIRFSMMSFFLIIMLALGLSIAADTMFNAEENNLYYLCKKPMRKGRRTTYGYQKAKDNSPCKVFSFLNAN